ncbi:sensor histidine kinase [Aquimarina macrocephali]|uniref:sensor histidine kinase n=1 Tax=Aquimarina macrocephali TaxID=666563 RepID=UPI001F4C8196|nr:histidine kinase [Aquimarina macrocephali]
MRLIISLGISTFLWLSGVICMASGIELTGTLFVFLAVSCIGYLLIFWLFNRKKKRNSSRLWTKNEIRITTTLTGLICFIGIFESEPNHPEFTSVFVLLFIYILVFSAVLIRNYYLQKKGAPTISKSVIQKLIFWSFVIGGGRTLIMFDEYENNDALIIIVFIYFPLVFFLATRWIFKQIKSILTLKNEKAKTELLHLKSQVNPHFFFNMLNNLYGWVDKDSKKAKELILKLSDMMRYSIYDGQKDVVTLEEEVAYLKNYIELHKMRYHKAISVNFNLQIENEGYKVMPLLFIILLENAFKHGVENLRENAYVHVDMIARENEIRFEVENNFDPSENTEQSGIGLNNLERRLELVYPKKHSISYTVTEDVYKAQLILNQL